MEVRAREAGSEFAPDSMVASRGDVLRFTTGDGRGHALAFDRIEGGDSASAFLDATGQRRSPPLLMAGAVWLVDLTDAPAGDYGVVCVTHGSRLRLSVRDGR